MTRVNIRRILVAHLRLPLRLRGRLIRADAVHLEALLLEVAVDIAEAACLGGAAGWWGGCSRLAGRMDGTRGWRVERGERTQHVRRGGIMLGEGTAC